MAKTVKTSPKSSRAAGAGYEDSPADRKADAKAAAKAPAMGAKMGKPGKPKAKGVPGGVIGKIARAKGAAPGGPNYHGSKSKGR